MFDQHQLTNFGQQVRLLLKLHVIWWVDSEENHGKGCHQRSILCLKCIKFDFGCGSAPDPAGGAHSAPPGPLAGFKGPTSKGEEGMEGKGRGKKGPKGREKEPPFQNVCVRAWL